MVSFKAVSPAVEVRRAVRGAVESLHRRQLPPDWTDRLTRVRSTLTRAIIKAVPRSASASPSAAPLQMLAAGLALARRDQETAVAQRVPGSDVFSRLRADGSVVTARFEALRASPLADTVESVWRLGAVFGRSHMARDHGFVPDSLARHVFEGLSRRPATTMAPTHAAEVEALLDTLADHGVFSFLPVDVLEALLPAKGQPMRACLQGWLARRGIHRFTERPLTGV